MLYTVLNVGDKEYKCRLTAKACVDLERKIGQNPLNVFTEIQKSNELPKVEDIIMILHASLQALEHNISLDDTYAIYDEFVDEGNTLIELIPIIVEIFKVSGFFKEIDNSKNAQQAK